MFGRRKILNELEDLRREFYLLKKQMRETEALRTLEYKKGDVIPYKCNSYIVTGFFYDELGYMTNTRIYFGYECINQATGEFKKILSKEL